METSKEETIIHIDHRIYHDEPKIVLDVYEANEPMDGIPETVEFSIHRMRGFDGIFQEIRRPPSEWVNHWLKLDYLEEPVPVLFDADGHPYAMAPALASPVTVKVMIREEQVERILDLLKVATEFCDSCHAPLEDTCNHWINEDDESIADVYTCLFCELDSIRWDKGFLERHPELQDGFKLRKR